MQFTIPNSSGPRLVVDPVDPANLYLGVYLAQAGPQATAYRSIDAGVTYFRTGEGGRHWQANDRGFLLPPLFVDLAVDPLTPTTLYASGSRRGVQELEWRQELA